MSTTGHETVYNSENPDQPSLFDVANESSAPAPVGEGLDTFHSGMLPIEEGGERPIEGGVKLPAEADETAINHITKTLPEHPGELTDAHEQPKRPNNKKRGIIASAAALALATVSFVGWKAMDSDSEQTHSTPAATSTPTPGKNTATATTTAPAASETATATPGVTNSAETKLPVSDGMTPHVTQAELSATMSTARVEALVQQYPDLANYLEFPSGAIALASDGAIKKEQDLVKSVFNDPNMAGFLENQNDPNDPEYMPWFTENAIKAGSPNTSTAVVPAVAFPDFALRWATFFWNSDQPHSITPQTHEMIKMAYLGDADAQKYEDYVAQQGIQIGHAKAVRSDTIGSVQSPDGKLFLGTVTEYAPGNNEPTGRVEVRWSLILPLDGAIKRAPADADYGVIVSQHYLGNAPAK